MIFHDSIIVLNNSFYIMSTKEGYTLKLFKYTRDTQIIKYLNIDKQAYINLALKNNGFNIYTYESPSMTFKKLKDAETFFKDLEPYIIIRKFL